MGTTGASASEIIQPNAGAVGITAEIAEHRSKTVVLHNSRIYCWGVMFLGLCSAFIGVCMALMALSLVIPPAVISFMTVLAAVQWGLGGVTFCTVCPAFWKWGRGLAMKRVTLNESGVDFRLGNKKTPVQLFMNWDNVSSVQRKKVATGQEYTVAGKDGSYASFTSKTFLRSERVARMIAERAGLAVQQG
jgi:hypothetical protein